MSKKFKVRDLVLFKSYSCGYGVWRPGYIRKHVLHHYHPCTGIWVSEMYDIEYCYLGRKYYTSKFVREIRDFNIDFLTPSYPYGVLLP